MDIAIIQGGAFFTVLSLSLYLAMKGPTSKTTKIKPNVSQGGEDDMVVDPGNLGSATGEPVVEPTKVSNIIQGVADLDITKNAKGLVDSIKGIPIDLIPDMTTGKMADVIRDLCRNGKHQMNRAASFSIAAKIKELRAANKAVPPAAANDAEDGSTVKAS